MNQTCTAAVFVRMTVGTWIVYAHAGKQTLVAKQPSRVSETFQKFLPNASVAYYVVQELSSSIMDWAEELKMSIRKTARKGRRSKSRDLDLSSTAAASSSSSVTSPAPTANRELSIDITLDMQHNATANQSASTTATSNADNTTDIKAPPLRRISGGWADTGGLKSSKFKRSSFDDERFQYSAVKSATSSPPIDDIPVIPDLDDIKDELLLNEIVEPPSVSVNRVVALKELNSEDLLTQNAFSAIHDVDLSILTRCLQAQSSLDESDEVWEWEKLFTAVTAAIYTEKSDNTPQSAPLHKVSSSSADEIAAPAMYT